MDEKEKQLKKINITVVGSGMYTLLDLPLSDIPSVRIQTLGDQGVVRETRLVAIKIVDGHIEIW